ncbi:MAG: bifunctional methionine sulfoxide reductase B/A protein [Bdellovibrionaceae bacterium]|nr:bifunctional methionine sulfoxide reductase B/A protein [Pseudobdellovibrionaceae bacterium]
MKHFYKIGLLLVLSGAAVLLLDTPNYNFYKKKIINSAFRVTKLFSSVTTSLKKKTNKALTVTKSKYDLKNLSPEEYEITQNKGTEAAFANKYWDNKEEGIYVDKVSGKALFSSKDKYTSGSGWPSFTKPLDADEIKKEIDNKLNVERVEIHSKSAKTHLGHVFNDGPKEKGGKRFCVNSASLQFISLSEMKKRGYEQYLKLFKNKNTKDETATVTKTETATLAGGCFWGVQHLLKKLPGVISSQAGYTGGTTKNPTYNTISTGLTSHAEAVQIVFDPQKVSYTQVLDYFWRLHNPTELNKQGPDVGIQYRSAIFYHSEKQEQLAQASLTAFDKSGVFKKKAVTQIVKASTFYPAEKYHQDYFSKNTGRVCHALRDK